MLNLQRVLSLKGIPDKACAGFLEISEKAFFNKKIGASEFRYSEVLKLKQLLPEYDIDYLLAEAEDSRRIV